MTVYCDTSLLVPLLTPEAFGDWTDAEIASALAQKQRSGRVSGVERTQASAIWRDLSQGMSRVEIVPDDFAQVAHFVDSGARGLRASDALHLAVVLRRGLDLATFGRDLASAARAEGVVIAFGLPDA